VRHWSTGWTRGVPLLSHHHPDHTLNAALFTNARFHDFQATYQDDVWLPREFTDDVAHVSPSVRLLLSPGHTAEDVSTLVMTTDGLVVCTHLWWTESGPADDPFAPDRGVLRASRAKVLGLDPVLIVPVTARRSGLRPAPRAESPGRSGRAELCAPPD
jgi:glyoxylase-like metal-dependent hydrolase (beta-lactamase superfamily II)